MAEDVDFMKLAVKVGAENTQVLNALLEISEASKQTAKEVSFVGLMSKKVMLEVGRSSLIAGMYMQEFHAVMGAMIDSILVGFMPIIEPIMEFLWDMQAGLAGLEGPGKVGVLAVVGIIAVLWLLHAHPVIFAISALILTLKYLEDEFGFCTAACNEIMPYFEDLGVAIEDVTDALGGESGEGLIGSLKLLAIILEITLAPKMGGIIGSFNDLTFSIDNTTKSARILLEALDKIRDASSIIPTTSGGGGISPGGTLFDSLVSGLGI